MAEPGTTKAGVSDTAPQQVVIEPVVNIEKLRQLLALGTEYDTLDFKLVLDLRKGAARAKHDLVELAKDVGAMSVKGGYIVIGVDGRGVPTGAVTEAHTKVFDEASLRAKLLAWLPDTLEIHTQRHVVDDQHHIVLIYVAPNPAGCAFFRADGQYAREDGKSKTVFQAGEVFFRNGTQSARLTQQGLEQVIARRVHREQQRWEAEHTKEYSRLVHELTAAGVGQQIARGPAAAFNLALDTGDLLNAAIELLRAKDDIPLRLLLDGAPAQARRAFADDRTTGGSTLIDRLTCLAALFLRVERHEWFHRSITTLGQIFDLPFEQIPVGTSRVRQDIASIWLSITERVIGLGALAVHLENWPAVRALAERSVPIGGGSRRSWIHHGLVMAGRANVLREGEALLLSRAREVVRQLDCLYPDTSVSGEELTTSLAQFDFLACLVGYADDIGYHPNFAPFEQQRTRPIAERLVNEPAIRAALFTKTDEDLAGALHQIDRWAQQVGWKFDGWEGYSEPVRQFIAAHTSDLRG